jgi:hypothetical protein
MLGIYDLDFFNVDLNSLPRVCGSYETTDSTTHVMFRLEFGFCTGKFKSFINTVSLESVRICLQRLRISLLQSKAEVDNTFFFSIIKQGKLTNMNFFLLIKNVPD